MKPVGIDFGCISFITLSTGQKFAYPDSLKRQRKAIDRTAGKLRRTGIKRQERAKLKAELAKAKDVFQRATTKFIDGLVSKLVARFDAFMIEDINKERLLRSGRAVKSIVRMPWKRFIDQLIAACRKRKFVYVMVPAANTSRRCHVCKELREDLRLSDRTYNCLNCGLSMDRDENAAKGILAVGQTLWLYGTKTISTG